MLLSIYGLFTLIYVIFNFLLLKGWGLGAESKNQTYIYFGHSDGGSAK